jgi:branched-chain amino acid aminotransferase
MSAIVNINGEVAPESDAKISVFDHGFLYGEGVYETLRTYNRVPFLFDRHMRRLRESAGRIALPVPFSDGELLGRVRRTVAALREPGEAYVRMLLTRGVGELSYDPRLCPAPSLVIIVKPHVDPPADHFEAGVSVALVTVMRNHPLSVDPRIKSNNLLNNALAMQEALGRGAAEALMKNYRGELVECSMSNFFLVRGGAAFTPPADAGLLKGITREFLFEIGHEVGVRVEERVLHESDLETADEAFFTSTTRELLPVVRVDDRVIGDGRPGPVTKALLGRFRERAQEMTTGISYVSE